MTNEEKDKIYDFLSSFLIKRQILNMKGEERLNLKLDKILIENDYILELPKITLENVKNYLTSHWDKKCGIKECNNNKKSIGLLPRRNTKDIYPFCSKKCASLYFSNIQKGDNNTSHKMTEETRKKSYKKQSISMKKKIKDGLFVPPISNSWAKSRCDISFIRNNKIINLKLRSCWEAYFQLFNPDLLYEKLVIPYVYNNEYKNYIIDFVDHSQKTFYEIKPKSNLDDDKVKVKIIYAEKWAKENSYNYVIITDEWFKNNYDEKLVLKQSCTEKLIRNLKQFKNENKKNKKNRL
jgi:hypothetical protein